LELSQLPLWKRQQTIFDLLPAVRKAFNLQCPLIEVGDFGCKDTAHPSCAQLSLPWVIRLVPRCPIASSWHYGQNISPNYLTHAQLMNARPRAKIRLDAMRQVRKKTKLGNKKLYKFSLSQAIDLG